MSTQNKEEQGAPEGAPYILPKLTHISALKSGSFILSLVLFLFFSLAGVFIYKFLIFSNYGFKLTDILVSFILLLILPIFHEILHALGYIFVRVKPSQIKISLKFKGLSFYCVSKEKITLFKYRFVSIFPLVVTGILPYLVAVLWLNYLYIVTFSLGISICSTDIIIFLKSLKYEGKKVVLDHESLPGFIIQ